MSAPPVVPASPPAKPESRRRVISFSQRDGFDATLPPERINDVLAQYDTLLWMDIANPGEDDIRLLREELRVHPLAIEDVLSHHPRPKCAEYPGLYVLVMDAV